MSARCVALNHAEQRVKHTKLNLEELTCAKPAFPMHPKSHIWPSHMLHAQLGDAQDRIGRSRETKKVKPEMQPWVTMFTKQCRV